LGAHSALTSALSPATLTEVHAPVEPHSQQSRPLRRRQSLDVAHFENSGAVRVSKTWQRPATQRAPMNRLTDEAHDGHTMGAGQVSARNEAIRSRFTPANAPISGTPHGLQHPASWGTHCPGPVHASQLPAPPPAPPAIVPAAPPEPELPAPPYPPAPWVVAVLPTVVEVAPVTLVVVGPVVALPVAVLLIGDTSGPPSPGSTPVTVAPPQ
jgi:hypothetical protein